MGQYYRLINVSKSQRLHDVCGKAGEIILNIYDYNDTEGNSDLILLLLDLVGLVGEMTLEKLCLGFLYKNKQCFTLEDLPKHLQKKLDIISLAQSGAGTWNGDHLVIIGDESEFSPHPPDGEWKKGSIYDIEFPDFKPNLCLIDHSKLYEFCEGKSYKIVNLDKKQYLDPTAYEIMEPPTKQMRKEEEQSEEESEGEKKCDNVLDYARNKHGVVTELLIRLIYSDYKNIWDLKSSVTSQGTWAGDRITVCTAERLCDFESYKDVSNPRDVQRARSEEFYERCCIM